jgi:hypothetical protein
MVIDNFDEITATEPVLGDVASKSSVFKVRKPRFYYLSGTNSLCFVFFLINAHAADFDNP